MEDDGVAEEYLRVMDKLAAKAAKSDSLTSIVSLFGVLLCLSLMIHSPLLKTNVARSSILHSFP